MKNGFSLTKIDDNAQGKTIDALAKSRLRRQKFVSQYGLVPDSILVNDRHDRAIDLMVDEKGYGQIANKKLDEAKIRDKQLRASFGSGFKEARKGALSRFPQNIGRLLVKFYCSKKEITYDPFAGHNSRMQLVYEAGRSYIGVDISKEFMKANRKIKKILINKQRNLFEQPGKITLIEGSSSKVDLPNNHADFTITSPPYWDIEYYGDEPEQLGFNKTYEQFLLAISKHIEENFRILKPGAYCCWCVNDFRKDGEYHSYHSDLIPLFEKAGFMLFSIYIIDLGIPVHKAFIRDLEKNKIFPKRHEYCLIFKKPENKIRRRNK